MAAACRELVLEALAELEQDTSRPALESDLRQALLRRGVPEEEASALLAAAGLQPGGQVERDRLLEGLAAAVQVPAPAPAKPLVVAVCGISCSGKSTVASRLAAELNGKEDCKAICADDFFVFDQYLTDSCPTKSVDGRVWKDWESTAAIDWEGLAKAVRQAASAPDCPPYVVVEGFLLLARPESRALCDAAVNVALSREECWRRRRGRAESMAHLPPGFSNGDDERNYEVLDTYVLSSADRAAVLDLAAQRYPDEGSLAWLRMYFEEVIWPTGVEQEAAVAEASSAHLPVLRLDGDGPAGKEPWQAVRIPEALEFLRKLR